MKRASFDYKVLAMISITGTELGRLIALSRLHYDGKCRAAGMQGGFLYGMCNQWACHVASIIKGIPIRWECPASLDEDLKQGIPDEQKRMSVEVTLTWSELDLLAKIGEGEEFYCQNGKTPMMLTMQFQGIMRECVEEYTRINPTV